jgi:hypothetical protein
MRLKRSGCADSCDFRLERDKTDTLGQEYTTRLNGLVYGNAQEDYSVPAHTEYA